MAGSVILNEQKVIELLRQFIKEADLEACSILADNEQDLHQVPKVITSLRNEIAGGNWSKALQLVNSLTVSSSDLASMKYSICKQRYLESINTLFTNKVHLEGKLKTLGKDKIVKHVNPEQLKLVATHLKSLEELCSQEDYFKLSFLVSCPDLKTHPSYSDWNVQLGRSQTASSVCQQAMKLMYPSLLNNHRLPVKRSNRLLQLVTKGILYEKCEELLQHKTGFNKEYNREHGEILDLHSWLAQLPGEVFRRPIHKLSLCVEEQCRVKSGCNSSSVQQFVPSNNGHNHVSTTPSALSLPENEKKMIKNENGTAAMTTHHPQDVVEDDKQTKEDVTDGDNVSLQTEQHHNAEEDTKASTKYHLTQEIKTEINGYDGNPQQPQKTDTSGDLRKRDISTPENCQIEVQPMVNSSTPKPSHGKRVVELPITSPIDRDKEALDYGPYHTPTSLRRQVIDKSRTQVGGLCVGTSIVLHCVMKLYLSCVVRSLDIHWWLLLRRHRQSEQWRLTLLGNLWPLEQIQNP